MAIDPNRWTIKMQEAFAAASERARNENHAEITPDHLLAALIAQPEGLAVPLLGRAGVEPTALAATVAGRVEALAKAYGTAQPSISRETSRVLDDADSLRRDMGDEYLSIEHLLLALSDYTGVSRDA